MPEDAGEQYEIALSGIRTHFKDEEFEQALPLCVKACEIRGSPVLATHAAMARRCRVFALLSLSRWPDALQVCEATASAGEPFDFERAYCLYRMNRFQDSLDALSKAEDDARNQRLEAQIRYRMGDYEACASMYQKLHDEDANDVGLLVNAIASHVSGERSREALSLMASQHDRLESSYELCFNLACALIDEGRLREAEQRLQEAKRICVNELLQAEDLVEEDAEFLEDHEELAAILVQRGCVLQRRGANDQANELYSRVLRQRAGQDREVDITVLAVACNNVVALRSEGKSLFDSLKRINVASKESLEHKLTRKQTMEIAINKCFLLLQAHRLDEARRELQRLKDTFPGHPRVTVVQAALAFTEKKAKVCEEFLQAYLTQHPGEEEVLLPLAQLYAQQHRFDRAVEALDQMPVRRRAQPRTVEAIVALHQKQKKPDKAVKTLRDAISFWTGSEGNADEETLASVLRIAARLAMNLKDKAFAAEVFQLYLEKIDGSDTEALCGLVNALVFTDVERAEQYAARLDLPSYDHLDPEELENVAIPKIGVNKQKREREEAEAKAAAAAAVTAAGNDGDVDAETAADEKSKNVKKRHRTPLWPKGFDPANPGPPPDPERWLPKRERSEFKKKMKKRDKNLARGPQGSMPVDDNAFRKQGPSTAQIDISKGASRPSRNQGRKKTGNR